MREIKFNHEMVMAIIDGRKTQTRRIVKPQFGEYEGCTYQAKYFDPKNRQFEGRGIRPCTCGFPVCPHGQVGDALRLCWGDGTNTGETLEITGIRVERVQDISKQDCFKEGCSLPDLVKTPYCDFTTEALIKSSFVSLWSSIYGPDAWERNDWVWVIEFRRVI